MNAGDYWKNNTSLAHLTPPNERFPEIGLLQILPSVCRGSVFEFGCGDGRLSPAFDSTSYTGYDINPVAIEAARLNNPDYCYADEICMADTFLAYTVLLHIPDDEIQSVIDVAKRYSRIVIGEIIGRQWRRPGNPPVFNRSVREYSEMVGIEPEIVKVPYPRYSTDLFLMVFDGH